MKRRKLHLIKGVPYRVRMQDHYSGDVFDMDKERATQMVVRGVYAGDQIRLGIRYALFFNWHPPTPMQKDDKLGPVDVAFVIKSTILEARRIP